MFESRTKRPYRAPSAADRTAPQTAIILEAGVEKETPLERVGSGTWSGPAGDRMRWTASYDGRIRGGRVHADREPLPVAGPGDKVVGAASTARGC